jgi:hypothetical protein
LSIAFKSVNKLDYILLHVDDISKIIVVKFKGVHASAGASVMEGFEDKSSDHQVQAPTGEKKAAHDKVRAAEPLRRGIIYYPSYLDLD